MLDLVPRLWNETIGTHRQMVRETALDAAAALVAEQGLRAVTMSGIAERTGIGRATLYKYFPDVDAILSAWHERQIARHLGQLREARDQPGEPGDRLVAVLEALARIQWERYQHHAVPSSGEVAAFIHNDNKVMAAREELHKVVRDVLAEAAEHGLVRDDVSADELAIYSVHALTAGATLPSQASVRRLVLVTLAGLRPTVSNNSHQRPGRSSTRRRN